MRRKLLNSEIDFLLKLLPFHLNHLSELRIFELLKLDREKFEVACGNILASTLKKMSDEWNNPTVSYFFSFNCATLKMLHKNRVFVLDDPGRLLNDGSCSAPPIWLGFEACFDQPNIFRMSTDWLDDNSSASWLKLTPAEAVSIELQNSFARIIHADQVTWKAGDYSPTIYREGNKITVSQTGRNLIGSNNLHCAILRWREPVTL
ncbi:MAG: hypothetical protein WCK11_01000 [Candidatus Falkowbacteria bacterium]